MTVEILLRYVHFISIFTIVSVLVSEHLLLKKQLTRKEIGRLARIDAIYGIAALTLLTAGLTLFVIVGLLSIYPTVFFIKNRKGNPDEEIQIPKSIFWMLRFELLLLFIIPLLAGLMARGIGYFG